MKIQYLAVIFIVIIVPISMVISTYTKNEIKTLELQISYDTKLTDATYDALKAYQLNSAHSDSFQISNSKMRDINASVNTFYNSIASNFNESGYNRNSLKDYVPALVYTMYDGFYIYSPYYNALLEDNYTKEGDEIISKYKPNEKIENLKPYVYYSCRYKKGNIDVVITYSLDNYIRIQGKIGDESVDKSGYILDHVTNNGSYYRGYNIPASEQIYQNIYDIKEGINDNKSYLYRKHNGARYYFDGNDVITMFNNDRIATEQQFKREDLERNDSAHKYYENAFEMKKFIQT